MAKKNGIDRLTQDANAALAAGMSYGNWKAMHPVTQIPDTPKRKDEIEIEKPKYRRVCEHCGKEFFIHINRNQKFCSKECALDVNNERARAAYRKRKENK